MGYSGKIYDIDEPKRIQAQLAEQDKIFSAIEREKNFGDKSLLRYAILGGGAIVLLVLLRTLIKK
jgi:hypothetical protein